MFQSDLRPVPGSVHKKKRVGRGNASGHGTYAGRGIKGQKSRSGPDLRIGFEGGQIPLVRALSRVRGFNNKFRVDFEPVNLERLSAAVRDGEVTVESLKASGIIKTNKPVKVLADGELSQKLKVTAHRFSAAARAKIEAAGGSVVELLPRTEKAPRKEKASGSVAGAPAEEAAPATPAAEAPPAAPAPEAPPAAPVAEAAAEAPKARRSRAAAVEKAPAPAAEEAPPEKPAPRTRRRVQPAAEPEGQAE
jgi:large subunit ribosomal protein L15